MDFFKDLIAQVGAVDQRWLVIAGLAVVLAIIIFALDKPQAMMSLLILYALAFIALQIPSAKEAIKKSVSETDFRYLVLMTGAIPIVALAVLKFKRKRK